MSEENQPLRERIVDGARIDRALREGVRKALLRHHKLGEAVAVWKDGRVATIPPEDIPREIGDGNGRAGK